MVHDGKVIGQGLDDHKPLFNGGRDSEDREAWSWREEQPCSSSSQTEDQIQEQADCQG